MTDRAPSSTFDLDIERIRSGHYTDQYFNRTCDLVTELRPDTVVRMQVFQKNHAVLGGIDEAIAMLRECIDWSGIDIYHHGIEPVPFLDGMIIKALHEGDDIAPGEPVMTIEGPYRLFAHLETIYLGILARRTLLRTNCEKVIKAANGTPVIFMPARHDHYVVQPGDGYIAHLAGMEVSTDAQASWFGGKGIGTVPHALIAAFDGNTVEAAKAFARKYGDTVPVSVLVDFENDCSRTAVEVADALKTEGLPLDSVRLDTSEKLMDRGLRQVLADHLFDDTIDYSHGELLGVCPALVRIVRIALNEAGHPDVKIIVSGGFNSTKINMFENRGTPVDAYGVGSSLLRGSNDFTADIISVNGKPCAKVGRSETPNHRLELVV